MQNNNVLHSGFLIAVATELSCCRVSSRRLCSSLARSQQAAPASLTYSCLPFPAYGSQDPSLLRMKMSSMPSSLLHESSQWSPPPPSRNPGSLPYTLCSSHTNDLSKPQYFKICYMLFYLLKSLFQTCPTFTLLKVDFKYMSFPNSPPAPDINIGATCPSP